MIKFFPRITILFLLIQTLIQAQSTTQPIDGVAAVVGKSIITVSDIEIAALQKEDRALPQRVVGHRELCEALRKRGRRGYPRAGRVYRAGKYFHGAPGLLRRNEQRPRRQGHFAGLLRAHPPRRERGADGGNSPGPLVRATPHPPTHPRPQPDGRRRPGKIVPQSQVPPHRVRTIARKILHSAAAEPV